MSAERIYKMVIAQATEDDSNSLKHARKELELAGMPSEFSPNEHKEIDIEAEERGDENAWSMNQAMANHLLGMVALFSLEGHSGASAEYASSRLNRLLRFKPITPLTGKDEEWNKVDDTTWQNVRMSSVFKKRNANGEVVCKWNGAYVFVEPSGSAYTTGPYSSMVIKEFPWMPPKNPYYVEVPADATEDDLIDALRKVGAEVITD